MAAMLSAALLMTGCAAFQNMSSTGKGATIGGGGGAVAGAGIGALAGGGKGAAIGTLVGAGVGAGVGALIGKRMDKQKAELEKIEGAKVETVTDENNVPAIKVTFDDRKERTGRRFAFGAEEIRFFAGPISRDGRGDLRSYGQYGQPRDQSEIVRGTCAGRI